MRGVMRRLIFALLFIPVVVLWFFGMPLVWVITGESPAVVLDKFFAWGMGESWET